MLEQMTVSIEEMYVANNSVKSDIKSIALTTTTKAENSNVVAKSTSELATLSGKLENLTQVREKAVHSAYNLQTLKKQSQQYQ